MNNKISEMKNFFLKWSIVVILLIIIITLSFLFIHPYFNLDNIEMNGNETYTLENFKKDSGIYGKNYFFANTDKAEENIINSKDIIDIKIEKDFPNKVKVKIVENSNIFYILNDSGQKIYVNRMGNISERPSKENEKLPLIVGVNPDLIKNTSIFNDKTIKLIYDSIDINNISYDKLNLVDKNNMYIEVGKVKAFFGDKTKIEKKFEIISKIIKQNDTKGINIKEIHVENIEKPVVIEE